MDGNQQATGASSSSEKRPKTAKALREALREVGIFNPHNLCAKGGGTVYVDYRAQQTGLAYRGAAWQVIAVRGPKTDPSSWWGDYGNKTFDVQGREDKEPQRVAALAFASDFLSVNGEWVKDCFGAYQRPEVVANALALLDGSCG